MATSALRPEAALGAAGPSAPASPPTVRFQKFVIKDDPSYTGMEVTRGIIPAGWTLKGGAVWDLRNARPAQFRIHASDPQDIAAYDVYPNNFFYWSADAAQRGVAPGFRYMGELVMSPPPDQFTAVEKWMVPQYRPELAGAKVVEREKLPKIAQAAFQNMPQMPGYEYRVAAGRVRFEYELKGKTVQEDMYVVFKLGPCHDGPRRSA